MNQPYHIYTNTNHRRILVIENTFDVDADEDLLFEDFDAMFVNVVDPVMNLNKLAINLASPLQSEKCRFKPCFATKRLQGWLGDFGCIVDGYAASPEDTLVAQTIEEIYSNMQRINFLLGTDPVVTHTEEIIRLCRFAISRRRYTFSNLPTPGIYSGYMELYHHTIWNPVHEHTMVLERNFFHEQLLRLGYITRKRFIDRMHTCPNCNRSHLFFFETCPKCDSSDVTQEDVIHHFRCANVAPASAFEWDGQLRCPKCKRELRHIGVDYDKPSRIYTCRNCGDSFMYPDMRVMCAQCHSTMKTSDLRVIDAEEYEFTPDGIRAFANYDVTLTLPRMGFFGHGTMDDFEEYIRQCTDSPLVVFRYHIYNPDEFIPGLIDGSARLVKAFSRLFTFKSALLGSDFYFLGRAPVGDVASHMTNMEYELDAELAAYKRRNPGFNYHMTASYTFHPSEDAARFIDRIKMNA